MTYSYTIRILNSIFQNDRLFKLILVVIVSLFFQFSVKANLFYTQNTNYPFSTAKKIPTKLEKNGFVSKTFYQFSKNIDNLLYKNVISDFLAADVTLPYNEDFESATTGDPGTLPTGWINDSGDGSGNCAGTGGSLNAAQCHDWQVHSGATPSTSPIGPNADHTTGSGIYVYYEDSGNPNTAVNLLTPSFDLAGTINPEVSVWVYAQSNAGEKASTAGTEENLLHFDVMNSTGTAVVASDITMTIGDNDFSDWVQYAINLSDYIGNGDIRLRFRIQNDANTTGSHDIAIDDFVLQDIGPLPNTGLTCTPDNTEITGKVFEDYDFDGSNDFGETFGFNGITVTATDALGNTVSTSTDASGNYTLAGLTANTNYRVEFTNFPVGTSPTLSGTDNGTTVQFIPSGNCANLGLLDISNGCLFRDGSGGTGDSPGWLNIGDTSNPADGNSYSTTVNGSTIVHNSANQIGRGAVNYEYWILDNHIRVRDFLGFLNAVDPTNSTERWEGGLLHDGVITYDSSEPIGSRWKTIARNTCTQNLTAAQVELMILNYTSFKVAARYANWAATGNINQGAYTFSDTFSADADITAIDSNWEGLRLITEDEIYKALYWDQANLTYNLYGTTTLQANGIPIVSDVDSDGILTVSNGNVYNISSGCFKLIRTKQGGQSPYGLYFGMGDFHDMVIPHDVTFPMTTNVVRPNNQLVGEVGMRSSYRLNTNLSYDEAFPSPGFRLAASSNPCVRPIEIGNYVWSDSDANGIQDADEVGIDGVTIELLKAGVVIASTQTANGGQYYFSSASADDANLTWTGTGTDTALVANMTYIIRISDAIGGSQQAPLNGFTLSTTNANSNNSDNIDNDASPNGNNVQITAVTGNDGEVNHSFDMGFVPCQVTAAVIAADQTICSGDDPVALSATTSASGNGTLSYQWQSSTTNCTADFVNLNGEMTTTYAPPALTETTFYRLIVINTNGTAVCQDTSNCVTITVNPNPTLTVDDRQCNFNALQFTYTVELTSNADQVTINPNNGTVTNNNNGTYTISDIPDGEDISITATNTTTNCVTTADVTAPNCPCPAVNAPTSNGDQTACENATPYPALTVTVGLGETADWYATATGGTPLASGTTSYVPPSPGTYYAETRNITNGCTSNVRTAVTLTVTNIQITSTTQTCQDNGTGGDSNDDYFNIEITATNANPGASNQYNVYHNTELLATGIIYGNAVNIEWADAAMSQRFAADNSTTYTLRVEDIDNSGCSTDFMTVAQPSCSTCPPQICLPVNVNIKKSDGTN